MLEKTMNPERKKPAPRSDTPSAQRGPGEKIPTEKERRQRLIGYVVAFILTFILPKVIPPWGTVTELGVAMLCTFVSVMVIFMTSADMIMGSMFGCVACLWHGYCTADDIYIGILGNSTAMQILMLLCWGMLMRESDAMQILGRKLIRASGKLKKHPILFNILFMEAMLFCAMFSNAVVFVVTVIPMFEGIAEAVGYKRTDNYFRVMITGLYMVGCCLGSAKGVGGMSLGVIKVVAKQAAELFPFTHNVAQFNTLVRGSMVIFVIVYVLLAKFLFRCDFSKLANADVEMIPMLRKENCRLGRDAKFLLAGFVVIMGRAYLPNPFPESWHIHTFYEELALPFVVMVILIVFSFFKKEDGAPMINVGKALARTNWGVLWSIGAMTIIAGSVSSAETGIRPWLVSTLTPIFGGHSYPMLVFLVLLFTAIITNLMSNLGTAVIMGTVAVSFMQPYVEAGINPLPFIAAIVGVSMTPLLTPSAGPIAPIYLNRPEMDKKFVYTAGIFLNFVVVLIFTACVLITGNIWTNPALI